MRSHTIAEVEAAGGYQILLADPAWQYRQGGRGAATNHYATAPMDMLAALPVRRIAADNAVLFLWVTWPIYIDAPEAVRAIVRAWGFEPKTLGFLWVKTNKKAQTPFWGGGSWTRANSEFCILCTRGDIRVISHSVHQLIESWDETDHVLRVPSEAHSAKPSIVRDKILELMGNLPAIELFARERVDGWDAWGNDPALGEPDVDLRV